MKKSEMTIKQSETYTFFREILSKNNFQFENDNELFDNSILAEPEIQASYENKKMEIYLEYTILNDLLNLRLYSIEFNKEIEFDLFPESNFKEVLRYIISFKDEITDKNYQQYINEILKICPKVFTYRDNKPFMLKPNK